MTRALYILPLIVLGLIVAWFGMVRAPLMSETEIIDTYAALWVTETGGGARLTDCAARPLVVGAAAAKEREILVITCENARDAGVYLVDRRGFLIDPATLGLDGASL